LFIHQVLYNGACHQVLVVLNQLNLSVRFNTSLLAVGSFVVSQSPSMSCQSYQKTGFIISVGFSIVVIVTLSNSTFCSQLLFRNALKIKLQVHALFNLLNQ
jgi:hypothetical protein